MSLLICSSSQDVYETRGGTVRNQRLGNSFGGSGIQQPASFENFINPAVVIPANSEVALQSIKFRRSDVFEVLNDLRFGWYYGEGLKEESSSETELSYDINDTTSSIIPITIKAGSYTMETFSEAVADALANRFSHPDWFRSVWVSDAASSTTSASSDGYYWELKTQGHQYSNDTKSQLITCKPWLTTSGNFTYTAGTGTFEATGGGGEFTECCGILQDLPLSHTGGRCEFDTTDAQGGFKVGLTRPTARDGREQPMYFSGNGGMFFDYEVMWSPENVDGETLYVLSLRHAVWSDAEDGLIMEDIEYYNEDGAAFSPEITSENNLMISGQKWTDSDGPVNAVHFEVKGQNLIVKIVTDGPTTKTVIDTTLFTGGASNPLPVKGRVPKPTCMATWTMYPKIALLANEDAVVMDFYSGVKPVEEEADGTLQPYRYPLIASESSTGIATNGDSVYMRSWDAGGEMATIMRQLESRYWNGIAGSTPARSEPYRGLDSVNNAPDMTNVLILKPHSKYSMSENPVDDVSDYFGFSTKKQAYVRQTQYGFSTDYNDTAEPPVNTTNKLGRWVYDSSTTPIGVSGSLFVRTTTLTNKSHNFGKSIPSQIIYHCPKFDNQGNQAGDLYFEPHEKTYLSLNNPAPLTMNNIKLELVDKNERVAGDLTGSTTVVLHIRKEKA